MMSGSITAQMMSEGMATENTEGCGKVTFYRGAREPTYFSNLYIGKEKKI